MLAQKIDHGSLFRHIREPVSRQVHVVDARRLAAAHHGYAARRVPRSCMGTLLTDGADPAPGDLVLARVSRVGRFDFAELSSCMMTPIKEGDEIIACYAPVKAEGELAGFRPGGEDGCQLVNPAGIASRAVTRNYLSSRSTRLEFLGRLGDDNGKPLNIADWSIPSGLGLYVRQPVIAVIGDRSLPGESCRAADVIRGLSGAGFRVGAANITGIPGCWKVRLLKNAGARVALDITDAGYVSTSGQDPEALESVFLSLSGYLSTTGTDVMVLEIEQDVFGHDTAAIVSMPSFQNRISTIILQGQSGMRAEIERDSLRAIGYDVTLVDEPGQKTRYQRII